MESIQNVKDALNARSTTTSLEELGNRGRKRVKVIKAEHVAQMIRESVERALTSDDRLPKEEIDRLVEESRAEFAEVMAERQREHAAHVKAEEDLQAATRRLEAATEQLRSLEADLQEAESENTTLREQVAAAPSAPSESTEAWTAELEDLRQQTDSLRQQLDQRSGELAEKDTEIERLQTRVAELESRLQDAPKPDALSAQLLTNLMSELATLKAQSQLQQQQQQVTQAPQPQAAQPDNGVLEQFVSSMNDRLEQFGKKMGISSAVESDNVDLSSMFEQADEVQLESNLDTMEVKAKSGAGIAANLERLKKLKGGGA